MGLWKYYYRISSFECVDNLRSNNCKLNATCMHVLSPLQQGDLHVCENSQFEIEGISHSKPGIRLVYNPRAQQHNEQLI